jgi:nucleoid-associated protein YgaU
MNQAIAALITAGAGTGGPANPNSRYYGAAVEQLTLPVTSGGTAAGGTGPGTPVNYLTRRIIPQPTIYASTTTYIVVDGDRLDNLAQRFLGDPTLYWMICDANGATDPDELIAQAGRTIVIPVAASVPPGARNG